MSSTHQKGRRAEQAGEDYLASLGYRVVGRNLRTAGGELDRVAWDGETLCFIEIRSRARRDLGLPEETVDARKQARLVRAAEAYLQRFGDRPPACRFDVLAVDPSGPRFRLYRDAFAADG